MNNNFECCLNSVVNEIKKLLQKNKRVLIAIDGMSGSGKTTLANELSKLFSSTIIHMDDFFLQPEQRTETRLKTPGGNIDVERLLEEVMIPLSTGEKFLYKPFNCHTSDFEEGSIYVPEKLVIAEGTYSCHPELFKFYDLHIFLYVDKVTQANRILIRNGSAKAETFMNVWVPLEDKYFSAFCIKDKCELSFNT